MTVNSGTVVRDSAMSFTYMYAFQAHFAHAFQSLSNLFITVVKHYI